MMPGLTVSEWRQLRYRLGIDGTTEKPTTEMVGNRCLPEALSRLYDGSGHHPTTRPATINYSFLVVNDSSRTVVRCVQDPDANIPAANVGTDHWKYSIIAFSNGGCQGASRAIGASTFDQASKVHELTISAYNDELPAVPQNGDALVIVSWCVRAI